MILLCLHIAFSFTEKKKRSLECPDIHCLFIWKVRSVRNPSLISWCKNRIGRWLLSRCLCWCEEVTAPNSGSIRKVTVWMELAPVSFSSSSRDSPQTSIISLWSKFLHVFFPAPVEKLELEGGPTVNLLSGSLIFLLSSDTGISKVLPLINPSESLIWIILSSGGWIRWFLSCLSYSPLTWQNSRTLIHTGPGYFLLFLENLTSPFLSASYLFSGP